VPAFLLALLLLGSAPAEAAAAPAAPAAAVAPPGLRYEIQVSLDPLRHRLTGRERIVYRSGADTALTAIWLHAYPNALRDHRTIFGRGAERAEDYALRFTPPGRRGWMAIDSVRVDGVPAALHLDETVGRIVLPRPLAPRDSAVITCSFVVQIPGPGARLQHVGRRYTVTQWYPKIAVYDERGWVCDPYYYASEFYGDFASFDVAITLPDRHWVGATGLLVGAEGGDNEIPLFDADTPRDSVTMTLAAALADSLPGGRPAGRLEVTTDLAPRDGAWEAAVTADRDGRAALRVPRGAPVHYAYRWTGGDHPHVETDAEGRPGPLRLLIAGRDTTIADTLRAVVRAAAPRDSVLPSLKTLRFHADQVHDFAWVAAEDYVRSDTTVAGIAVRALAYREDQKEWAKARRMTADAIAYAGTRVGPYIWPQFTSAEAPCDNGSAMEYPMLTTNDPALHSPVVEILDPTLSHELYHDWFYGMLASDERAHPWLDEGFTQWLEQDHLERKYPRGLLRHAARFPWLHRLGPFEQADELPYLQSAWTRDEQPMGLGADAFVNYSTYGTAVYAKPACMLHTLRGVMGDSLFGEFLRLYYRRGLLRHPRPGDVYRAAADVSGRDLARFFDDWVNTTRRASFALGGIRREHEGDAHRSVVTVRRLEKMVIPVTVEARFADGTRQERQVEPLARETPVVFESRSRLAGATLDPRHEIVEMNRLDNSTGLLPPMRFRPLFDFPSSEEMGFWYGPTIWHGRTEGARLGLWVTGAYLPSAELPHGIRKAEAGISVGTRDGDVAWRLAASRRWGAIGARSVVRAEAVRDAGLFRAGLSAGNTAKRLGGLHPFMSWELAARYRDRYDVAPVDPRYWTAGRSVHGEGRLELETVGPRHRERFTLDLRRGAAAFPREGRRSPDIRYDRASIEAAQTLTLLPTGGLTVGWRAFGGTAQRRTPRELLFDVAEGSRLDAIHAFYLNDRGPVRASGRYLHDGGGGVRGYADRAILGKRVLAASVSASHRRLALPATLFADGGRVEGGGAGARTLYDAGATIEQGPVRFTFPLWLSHPDRDEKPWEFRWRVTLTTHGPWR
jgi:hypothetical protein